MSARRAPFRRVTLDGLRIDDERSLRQVEIYAHLKQRLQGDGYHFRVPRAGAGATAAGDWNRALLLNLGFWSPDDPADVLVEARIPADVVAHVAWHHVAARALGPLATTVDGLLLGESIASAFDLYLVGRLLRHAPRSSFLASQVPAMSDVAASAGLSARAFSSLLAAIAADPERAFADLRALLFRAATQLVRAGDTEEAAVRLAGLARNRFHALLHHYNLANWILSSRAHAGPPPAQVEPGVSDVDRVLSRHPAPLDWLDERWVQKPSAREND